MLDTIKKFASRCNRHRWRTRLVVFSIAYMTFFMFGGCADRFLLYPSTDALSAGTAVRRAIPFEKGELEAWVARSPATLRREPQAFVLAFCGNAERAEWGAADTSDWGDKPVELWTINHPGFGGSSGPASLSRLPNAALAAYDAMAKAAGERPIYVCGRSLGATLALHVAAQRPAAGLVLRTPPPLRQLIHQEYGWWNLWMLSTAVAHGVPAEMGALENARLCKIPAVILLADYDEVVPYKYQKMVADAYAGPKEIVIMSGASHNSELSQSSQEQLRQKLEWLWGKAKQSQRDADRR
jgi:pimeloyl-ACP methyl ester carboxylesterase